MTRLWSDGLHVEVKLNPRGLPVQFTWANRSHPVRKIEQHWQIDTDWWTEAGRVWRTYVTVTTTTGLLCVLFQDLLTTQWYLQKVYD